MKKFGRAITGGGHHSSRDGQSGRRNSSSQGSKNTDSQQSGGATAATGGPQPRPTGEGSDSRGGYQPPKGAGGGSKKGGGSKDTDHVLPADTKPTVSSQSRNKINVTTTKTTAKTSDPDFYKAEYRKLKGENEDLRANIEQLCTAVEAKDAELDKLNKFLGKKAMEFNDMEEKLKQMEDSVNKLKDEVQDKDAKVSKLTTEAANYEDLLKQAQDKHATVEVEYKKLKDHSMKVQEKVKKFKQHHDKEIEKLKEENKRLSESRDQEVAKWEDVEQKLAQTKTDLAQAQAKVDLAEAQTETDNKDYYVVENQDAKKIKEFDIIQYQTAEMNKMKQEFEDSKQVLVKEHKEILQQLKDEYQQLDDKMRQQAIEYEEKLKTTEAKVNWSHVKAEESERLQTQSSLTIEGLNTEVKALKKENKDHKSTLEEERSQRSQLADQIKKLQEQNKQLDGVIEKQKAELRKMENRVSKLQESETSKVALEKKHEVLLQSNDSRTGLDGQLQQVMEEKAIVQKQMEDGYKEREDRIAELEDFINDQVAELDRMEEAMKQTVANKEITVKELNEAVLKHQAELDALKVACEEKDEEISQLQQSASQMYDAPGKEESSQVSSELMQAEERLAEANEQLLAHKEEIQKLKEALLAKQESSNKGRADADGLRETTKRLSNEVAMLQKQITELTKQNESLTKRCDKFRSSNESLKQMMKMQPGLEMQTKFATKVDELNQQIVHLQEENERYQSLTTGASMESFHDDDQEFHSSTEYQLQGHSDHPAQLQKQVNELDSELQVTKLTLEEERKAYKEKMEKFQSQVSQLSSIKQSTTIGKVSEDNSKNVQDDVEQLQKEYDRLKQTHNQLYTSYQKLGRDLRLKEEENSKLNSQVGRLQDELSKTKEESDVAGLNEFVQQQHEKLVMAERDRDTATAKLGQKESEQTQIELQATITQMRNNHALVIKSKDNEITNLKVDKEGLVQTIDCKDQEIAELKAVKKDLEGKLTQAQDRVTAATTHIGDDDSKELGSCTPASEPASKKNSALIAVLSPVSKQNEQTTATVNSVAEKLSKHLIKTSGDTTGVGAPCIDPTHSEAVGGSPDEGNDGADAINSEMRLLQNQLSEYQGKVDELTKELAVEKCATENAKSEMDKLMIQLQQLQNDKRIQEQQMNDGYKEREDRIAELEEFINDQVAELDKMEVAMKQTVANKQILEKDYQKLNEYYNSAKKTVEQYESRFIAQEEKISQLEYASERINEKASRKIESLKQEKEVLIQTNENMSREVARLMDVDQELQSQVQQIEQYKLQMRKAEEELQTKEFLLNTYKEDFEQERKDRENAHNIKEDEIRKVRIEMENFEAVCQEKIRNVQQAQEAEMNSLREHANRYVKENEKLKKESEIFKKECTQLRDELDKERKDAHGKSALYKKKTEQFQLQWRKREEAEAQIQSLTEELNAQSKLNKQLNSTIDTLVRKTKGIEPQIPPNTIANQQLQSQQQQASHHPHFINVSAPMDTQSDQYHTSTAKPRPQYDTSVGHTNAEMGYHQQPPPSSTSQPAWQRQQEHQRQGHQRQQEHHHQQEHQRQEHQQHQEHQRHQEHQQQLYVAQQQQQEQLHIRGQGRGSSYNQPVKPLHEGTQYPPDYLGKKYMQPTNHQHRSMQPTNIDNYQPMSMQPECNIAGTNAAPLQVKLPNDDYNYYGRSGPGSLDTSLSKSRPGGGHTNLPPLDQSPLTASRRPEKPTQYASEAINEEIRYQADRQRRHQEYERFDSNLQLDPYLICPKCKLQFREGQLPEYRHHIDNCHH